MCEATIATSLPSRSELIITHDVVISCAIVLSLSHIRGGTLRVFGYMQNYIQIEIYR